MKIKMFYEYKNVCIVGMMVAAVLGYLRTRGLEGAFKTVAIILYIVAFIFFLLGAIILHNQGM